ncbi:MAG: type II toxin-antitoxin system RelE/ParE family toxin [Acidobacteria bacterium]|nr:type II toxin-antitoxin system RelE/ParE family toxin [Acidobacteriota bacterium]
MADVIVSPEALADLDQIHAYIAADNPAAADRVLEAALATFEVLAGMPGMGRPRTFKLSELAGMRSLAVTGFRNYLIFYRSVNAGVEIVRVLHGARDVDAQFSGD